MLVTNINETSEPFGKRVFKLGINNYLTAPPIHKSIATSSRFREEPTYRSALICSQEAKRFGERDGGSTIVYAEFAVEIV
ncbi:MAG TPA: hypothetical protein VH593_07245, partial [Ktedonobacteraceae bacterium]